MRRAAVASLSSLLLSLGCARPARPPALFDADTVRKGPTIESTSALAPEAFAHAEKLRKDAELAYENGDLAGAQLLAERAIAAYQHALVLARIARANQTAERAIAATRTAEQRLAEIDGQQSRAAAEADDLELRIKVIKDAAPLLSSGKTDPAREQARLAAARSLALDAKLLCASARMVGPDTPALTAALATVGELEKRLSDKPRPAPIDAAMRARVECLAALTAARRPASGTSSIGRSDQLLSEVSAIGGLSPVRDERGVVVTLRGGFSGVDVGREGRDRLTMMGRIAQAHPDFPVLVVVHSRPKPPPSGSSEREQKLGDAIAAALVDAGADRSHLSVEAAGTAHPTLDPGISRDPTRSERIEIIFVDPGG